MIVTNTAVMMMVMMVMMTVMMIVFFSFSNGSKSKVLDLNSSSHDVFANTEKG